MTYIILICSTYSLSYLDEICFLIIFPGESVSLINSIANLI